MWKSQTLRLRETWLLWRWKISVGKIPKAPGNKTKHQKPNPHCPKSENHNQENLFLRVTDVITVGSEKLRTQWVELLAPSSLPAYAEASYTCSDAGQSKRTKSVRAKNPGGCIAKSHYVCESTTRSQPKHCAFSVALWIWNLIFYVPSSPNFISPSA